jgi:hypothetical protein
MGKSVTGTLTLEQVQQEAAKQQLMAIAANTPDGARKFQFFAAFDGTRNNKDNVPKGEFQTNVANLYNQAKAASDSGASSNLTVGYYRGVGTGGEMGGWLSAGISPSDAVEAAAQKAYMQFAFAAVK